jgi:hypothetical protein
MSITNHKNGRITMTGQHANAFIAAVMNPGTVAPSKPETPEPLTDEQKALGRQMVAEVAHVSVKTHYEKAYTLAALGQAQVVISTLAWFSDIADNPELHDQACRMVIAIRDFRQAVREQLKD